MGKNGEGMIKVLIVDDETTTRNGLKKHIHWETLGIERIEDAGNAAEALEKLESLRPDIIISDICMPGMNGIALCRKIKNSLPDCQIIFLSGYSDKEYLKGAIELEAVDYIEKPINIREVEAALIKAAGRYEVLCRRKDNEERLDRTLSENRNLKTQKLIHQLIQPAARREDMAEVLAQQDIFKDKEYFTVILFKIKCRNENQAVTIERASLAIQPWFEGNDYIGGVINARHLIFIAASREGSRSGLRSALYRKLKLKVEREGLKDYAIYCVIGHMIRGIDNISASYQSAIIGLQRLFFSGYNHVEYLEEETEERVVFDDKLYADFERSITEYCQAEAEKCVKRLYQEMKPHRLVMVSNVKGAYFRFLYALFREAVVVDNGNDWQENEMISFIWDRLSSFDTLSDCQRYLEHELEDYFINARELAKTNKSVMDAKRCIQELYGNPDLSLNDIAERVYLSPTYLSGLFKKKVGITIGQYIAEVRVDQAKELLKDRRLKLYDIAVQVGYSDANYFTKIFKKVLGITPSEYREKYNT